MSGALSIRAEFDGRGLSRVRTRAGGLALSALLARAEPASLLSRLSVLVGVCREAQLRAAAAALHASGAAAAPADGETWRLDAETVRELLWRVLLDWPPMLGLPPWRDELARFYRLLTGLADAAAAAEAGRALQAWLADEHWLAAGGLPDGKGEGAPLGRLLRTLIRFERALHPVASGREPVLLPDDALAGWHAATAPGRLGDGLGGGVQPRGGEAPRSAPRWRGTAAETGPLARQWRCPAVAALRAEGLGLSARLLARLHDLREAVARLAAPAAEVPAAWRVRARDLGGGAALAWVDTARGLLAHAAWVEDGHIAAWRVLAPTDWHFGAGGALETVAEGRVVGDARAAEQCLRLTALAFDPCVEYDVALTGSTSPSGGSRTSGEESARA